MTNNTDQPPSVSVLGGRLIRTGRNAWQWSDGEPEPRVRDLRAGDDWNFRCRNYASTTYVEVLLSECHRHKETLGWVLAGVESGRYQQDTSGDHTGPMRITIDDDGELQVDRMRIDPGEDPLLGNEPILHTRAIPKVALVPVAEWDDWSNNTPSGASWDREHEDAILAKARSLGWTSP